MGVKAYAIADLHLGHPGIIEYRNFATMEEHDDYVVAKINEVVNPTDYLYILGDVVITPVGYKALAKINCQNLILVPGNHDGERAPIHYPAYVRTIGAYTRRLIPKHREVVFTHIPVHPITLDRWSFNIHGRLTSTVIYILTRYRTIGISVRAASNSIISLSRCKHCAGYWRNVWACIGMTSCQYRLAHHYLQKSPK